MEELITAVTVVVLGFLAFLSLRIVILHALYEVGASAEKRYKVASKMFTVALGRPTSGWRYRELHLALDVMLCEGKFDELQPGNTLHRKYWELGHAIAIEIMKFHDNQLFLNIGDVWFAENYNEALRLIPGSATA